MRRFPDRLELKLRFTCSTGTRNFSRVYSIEESIGIVDKRIFK